MKSIDNLREWANALHGAYINQIDHTITVTTGWDAPPDMDSVSLRDHVNGILDAIEREVEQLREREYQNGREDAKDAVEFADRLKACADNREDVTLFGVDYTPLPVDADGVPIHVGDVMEERSGHTFEAASLMAFGGSDNWLVLSDARNFSSFREPHDIRHHHAPTVEDVILDAISRCIGHSPEYWDEPIAECAAKLRLAGEDA